MQPSRMVGKHIDLHYSLLTEYGILLCILCFYEILRIYFCGIAKLEYVLQELCNTDRQPRKQVINAVG